jgi:uncharacterized protein (TIGR03437 family)
MAAPPPPVFSSAGVVNAASFLAGSLAPGQIFSVFGENLGPEIAALGRFNPLTGLLDTSIAGVAVVVNGEPAPLFYVSEGQINAQAPYEIAGSSTAVIEISRNGVSSGPITIPGGSADPALFQIPGTPSAVVLNQNRSINGASRPAARGSIVSFFGTGQGDVRPALATGEAAAAAPLSRFVRDVSVEIGGIPAKISFAGMAPTFVGLFQINAFVPATSASGAQVPVRITVDGVASQPGTTMAVE